MPPRRDPGRNMFCTSFKDISAEYSGMDVKLYSVTDISAEGPGKGYNSDIHYGCFRGVIRAEMFWTSVKEFATDDSAMDVRKIFRHGYYHRRVCKGL